MKTHSQKFLQQRKFYMALPILVLPFITMIFWALGGGQSMSVQAETIPSGLNMNLPGAHFKKEDELWDKFKLYELAKRDSIKYEEARRNDPYYVISTLKGINQTDSSPKTSNVMNTSLGSKVKYAAIDKDEEMIHQKLEILNQQLSVPEQKGIKEKGNTNTQPPSIEDSEMSTDIDRLEKMMQIMQNSDVNDPEMQQIENVLNKVLEIQNPTRHIDHKTKTNTNPDQQIFKTESASEQEIISVMGTVLPESAIMPVNSLIDDSLEYIPIPLSFQIQQNAFYGLDDELKASTENANAIEAIIHETQTVLSGSTIKMRLLSDVMVNGQLIKKDQFVYGLCSINGERLTITISSIRAEHSLLPVSLVVHDLDGMEGLYIPGAITRDVAKQATSQSIQDVELYSMDNSLGMQAATAGVEAVKGLFSKKAKLIKVTVKAGYQILLKDTHPSTP